MKNNVQQPNLFTVPEAAKYCGVSRNTLYTWVRNGKLPAYQTPGRTNLIRPTDLVKFMQDNGMFVPPELMEIAQEDEKRSPAVETRHGDVYDKAVLVVDDDAVARAMVVRALHEKHQVYQAETGYEALHLLTIHDNIHLILLDLRMPGQHGLATLQEIHRVRPNVRVIVVSGFAADVPEELIEQRRVTGILEKPIDIPSIRRSVEAAFSSPAPEA